MNRDNGGIAMRCVRYHESKKLVSPRCGMDLLMLDGLPTAQLGNRPLEEIVRSIQGVPDTDVSVRYRAEKDPARSYLELLDEAATAPEEKLDQYLETLAEKTAPFADNPAFQAFLELKRAAKLGR